MKLLLREHQFFWFAQSVFGFPRRFRWEPRALWEVIGAAKYAYVYSTHRRSSNISMASPPRR
jgi:hypothetical protein